MSKYKDIEKEPHISEEPNAVYGGNLDAMKVHVVESILRIQDANVLKSILSFIKNKIEWSEDIPNEETIEAMKEVENGDELEILDVENFEKYVASL